MDDKEIESLQSQLDDLNALIDETAESSSADNLRREQLQILFLKDQDGDLSQQDFDCLQEQLKNDPNALREYLEFTQISALLHLHFNPELAEQALTSLHIS